MINKFIYIFRYFTCILAFFGAQNIFAHKKIDSSNVSKAILSKENSENSNAKIYVLGNATVVTIEKVSHVKIVVVDDKKEQTTSKMKSASQEASLTQKKEVLSRELKVPNPTRARQFFSVNKNSQDYLGQLKFNQLKSSTLVSIYQIQLFILFVCSIQILAIFLQRIDKKCFERSLFFPTLYYFFRFSRPPPLIR